MAFGITSIEHGLAIVAQDIVKAAKFVRDKVLPVVAQDAPTIEAVTGLVSPSAAAIERGAFACLAICAKAVNDAGEAAGAGGLSVTLDATIVADLKSIWPDLKTAFLAAGSPGATK